MPTEVVHQTARGAGPGHKKCYQGAGRRGPFIATPPRPASWGTFPTWLAILTHMAPHPLWVVDLTYINLIRRHPPALTRDHTYARPCSAPARSTAHCPKSAGLKPVPTAAPLL